MKFVKFLWELSSWQMLLATIAGLISGSSNALLISLIDRSIKQSSLTHGFINFIGLAVAILLAGIISQFILINIAQNAVYQLRLRLSKHILAAPLPQLEHLGENRLLLALTEDVRILSQSFAIIPSICVDLATVIGCLVYLAILSEPIFALTVGASALSITYIQFRLKKAEHLMILARQEEDTLIKHFQSIIQGIKELKLNRRRREDFANNYLKASANILRQKNSHALQDFAVANGLGQLSQLTIAAVILFILPGLIHIPLPLLSSYVIITTFLGLPLQNILHRLPDIVRANISFQKIEMMALSLASTPEIDRRNLDIDAPPIHEFFQLKLDRVTYRYDLNVERHPHLSPHQPPLARQEHHRINQQIREKQEELGILESNHYPSSFHDHQDPPGDQKAGFLLGPIDLCLSPGEVTFIIGGNGSGKSTLAKVIAGLYLPESGAIYLDGVLITATNQDWYRQYFSAIFHDFYLFEQCLGFDRSNLDHEVENYLQQLELDRKVSVKDGTLSTIKLSQGQRKRLALLMSYLEDRPIYLFDEWAADQEPLFRDLFYNQILLKLKERGKAVLVITHDDRYYYLADYLIKLNYGKIETSTDPVQAAVKYNSREEM